MDATGFKRQETWMLRVKTGMSGDLGAGNLPFLPMLTPGSACSMLFLVFNPDKYIGLAFLLCEIITPFSMLFVLAHHWDL